MATKSRNNRFIYNGIAVILVASTAFTGCDKLKGEKPKAPAVTAKKSEGTPVEIGYGIEKDKWQAVKIGITDKKMNRDIIFTIDIGSTLQIPDSGLAIKVNYFFPDFQMKGAKAVSASNKPKNPAVSLLITDKDVKDPTSGESLKLTGYLFSKFPNNALSHPRYNFVLVDYIPVK
jgi:hypothetical protein